MFANYFQPVSIETINYKNSLHKSTIGHDIDCYYDNFPAFDQADFVIIFVPETRGCNHNDLSKVHFEIRKSFYNLFKGSWTLNIVDFGNFNLGKDKKDTYFALNDIVSNLLSQSVFPIVIGGSQDLTYPIYQSYQSFTKGVNLLCVDPKFDLIDNNSILNANNFVGSIIKKEPNHLNNFVNLGYQKHLCQNDESDLIEKMLFETCRLGDLRESIRDAEPYMRNSDIVSFDLSSIKQSDAPGSVCPSPNGLEAHHACVLARYAGMSDRVSSFGVFQIDSVDYGSLQTANLVAQIIWYFIEGFSLRVNDSPSMETINNNYQKYIIPLPETNFQYVFYKSKITGRWWVSSSIEYTEDSSIKEKIIPCSYEDYLNVNAGEIPKRVYRLLKLKRP